MLKLPRLVLLLVAALVMTPAAASAAPQGFQADLSDGTHVECSYWKATLSCLDYSLATSPGRCPAGGDVPEILLRRTGAPRRGYVCVDEGYHGWKWLSAGKSYRKGSFRCRMRKDATTLTCWNRSGKVVIARAA